MRHLLRRTFGTPQPTHRGEAASPPPNSAQRMQTQTALLGPRDTHKSRHIPCRELLRSPNTYFSCLPYFIYPYYSSPRGLRNFAPPFAGRARAAATPNQSRVGKRRTQPPIASKCPNRSRARAEAGKELFLGGAREVMAWFCEIASCQHRTSR